MSGFDTSQPIADEKALEDVDTEGVTDEPEVARSDADTAEAEKLGDATPGPR